MRQFQIVIRLQQVRASLAELRTAPPSSRRRRDTLSSIRSVASSAAEWRLTAFEHVCNEMGDRVERRIGREEMRELMIAKISDWAASSELYVRRPRYRPFARLLLLHLNDPFWGQSLPEGDGVTLVDQLTRQGSLYRLAAHLG